MALSLLVATTVTTDENVTAECHKKIRHNNVTDFPFSLHPLPAAVEQHPDRGVFIVDFTEIQVFVDCINFGIARQGDMDEKDTVLTISPAISGKSPMTRYSENTFP